MANHKSAIKRHRQSIKRREANRSARATVRTALKNATAAAASGDKAEAQKLARQAESLMSKASKKRLFHKATLARKISRLQSKAAKVSKKDARRQRDRDSESRMENPVSTFWGRRVFCLGAVLGKLQFHNPYVPLSFPLPVPLNQNVHG